MEPEDALAALKIKQGDPVIAGQVVAESRSFFGLFKSEVKSAAGGTVELITHATGHVGVRLPSLPVEVTAYVDGVVAEVMPEEGVVVETYGALVQGIFGVGGERVGTLAVPDIAPGAILDEDHIRDSHAGMVLVGETGVTLAALKKAAGVGVKGIVVGAIVDTDLIGYIGHDIGVAITGQEDIATTLILTEGFGSIRMAKRTFELLKSLDGRRVSINGATQIRAGVIRPEVIAPLEVRPERAARRIERPALEVGANIRVIRAPYSACSARVTGLPPNPIEIESGAIVRVMEAKLEDGREVCVPRANVEIIEG